MPSDHPPLTNDNAQLRPVTAFAGPSLTFDFPSFAIGVAEYAEGPTGCTVFHFPKGAQTAVDIRGGSHATLFTEPLRDGRLPIHAICLAGGSFVGSLLGLGIWGEGAYHALETSQDFIQLAAGADYTLANGLYLMGEYHYDERGRTRREEYQLTDWLRVLTQGGSLGRDRLFLGSSYPVTSLWRASLYALVNLNDRSAALNPWVAWNARESLEITLTAALPWGEAGSELGEYPRSGLLRLRVYY